MPLLLVADVLFAEEVLLPVEPHEVVDHEGGMGLGLGGLDLDEHVRGSGGRDRRVLAERVEVPLQDLGGRPVASLLSLLDPHDPVACVREEPEVMARDERRAARPAQGPEKLVALGDELAVARRERLIEDQDLGVERREGREREPRLHARAVGRERLIRVLADSGEVEDLVHVPFEIPGALPQEERVHAGVLPAREVGVKPCPELEDARDLAVHGDLTRRGPELSREELEERALSSPVDADDPYRLAAVNLELEVLERPEGFVVHTTECEDLAKSVARPVIEPITLSELGRLYGDLSHSATL